jgi:hypothetical protein
LIVFAWVRANRRNLFNLQKAKYSMVTIPAVLFREQPEENEHVTDSDPPLC